MKYEIPLTRTEFRDYATEAGSRDEAITKARAQNPGFHADIVVEIDETGEPGANHQTIGVCENCDRIIWDGEPYSVTADDVMLCPECAKACEESQP